MKTIALAMAAASFVGITVPALAEGVATFDHVVTQGETVSQILFAKGIGTPTSFFRLYGKRGWVARVKDANPHVTSWENLVPGQTIKILLPEAIARGEVPATESTAMQVEPVVEISEPEQPVVMTEEQAQVLARPDEATVEKIMELPPDALAQVSPTVIAEKLDETAIAKLSERDAEKVPPAVVEKKAWEYSIFDAQKPGMEKLFASLGASAPGIYAGVRYGRVPSNHQLFRRVSFVSLLLEAREGPLGGLRVMADFIPNVSATVEDEPSRIGYEKILLGWAIGMDLPWLGATAHAIPKVGSYALRSTYKGSDVDGVVAYDVGARAFPSLGLELDLEWSSFFYVLRGWTAYDSRLPAKDSTLRSLRGGVDVFLKGPGFHVGESPASLSYLIFASGESIELSGRDPTIGPFDVSLQLPVAGLGLSIAW